MQGALQATAAAEAVRAVKAVRLAELRQEVAEAQLTNELRSGARGNEARQRLLDTEARLAAAEASAARQATPKELSSAPALAQSLLEGLLENLSIADADAAEGRARRILGGLGFSARMQDGPLSHLSGTPRSHVAGAP
jgi:ATPase subunit of ABC transporter with duplicated ATPase domains